MEDRRKDPPSDGRQVPSSTRRVGFRQPPEKTQFKPGRSGNPRGRPKGSKSLVTLVSEHLQTKVAIRVNGRERKVPKVEVGLIRMANRFADKGELQMFNELKKLFDRPEGQTLEIRRPVEIGRLNDDQLYRAAEEHVARQFKRLVDPRGWVAKTLPGEPAWYEPPQSEPEPPPLRPASNN